MTRKQAYKTKYQGTPHFNYVTADRMYTQVGVLNFVLAYNNGFIRKGYHNTRPIYSKLCEQLLAQSFSTFLRDIRVLI